MGSPRGGSLGLCWPASAPLLFASNVWSVTWDGLSNASSMMHRDEPAHKTPIERPEGEEEEEEEGEEENHAITLGNNTLTVYDARGLPLHGAELAGVSDVGRAARLCPVSPLAAADAAAGPARGLPTRCTRCLPPREKGRWLRCNIEVPKGCACWYAFVCMTFVCSVLKHLRFFGCCGRCDPLGKRLKGSAPAFASIDDSLTHTRSARTPARTGTRYYKRFAARDTRPKRRVMQKKNSR